MARIIAKLANKWCIPTGLLEDIYFLLINDIRFMSTRGIYSSRYSLMSKHLISIYKIQLSKDQLRYLVKMVKQELRQNKN